MEPMKLSFRALMAYLNRAIVQMPNPRRTSNATKYNLADAISAAFSMFFMRSESFLEHQRQMESHQGKSNAQSLFGMIKVPTIPQIRNILDGVSAKLLSEVFNCMYQSLRRDEQLKPFKYLDGLCCSNHTHKNGTVTYFHSAILPVIVAPGQYSRCNERAKAQLIQEVTDSLVRILGKNPEHTHVVIQKIAEENWDFAGMLTDDWKKQQ